MLEGSDYLKLGLLVLFLAISAFFSGSETAFLALQRVRLMHLVRSGVPRARQVFRLAENPERFLSTVLLGNNLVNTAAAAIGASLVIALVDNDSFAILIATVGVTILLLIFGEIIPKTFAARHAERFAFAVSIPLQIIEVILFPIVQTLRILASLFTKLTGAKARTSFVTEQEIRSLISIGKEEGAVETSEAEMLEKVFHFGDNPVSEIMTPRPEIVSIEQHTTLRQFLGIYAEHYHTRFPVFVDSVDNIVGILSVKDVLKAQGEENLQMEDDVTNLLRPAHFVPETKTVGSLFSELQARGQSMAMIVDEFGGIAGLATLKQLLSVIVGPVGEEGQPLETPYASVDENTFILDAGIPISQLNSQLGLELPLGEYQTLAGFLLDRLGRVPEVGEHMNFNSLRFTVQRMEGVKIEEVEVLRLAPVQERELK